ncbi:MAG: TspO/MBR family protein [Pseudobdellovibrionaceae bacterium]
MHMTPKKFLTFLFFLLLFEGIGFFMGQMTAANIPTWYADLTKSALTPPGWVFGVVWPALYALLAAFVTGLLVRKDDIAKSGLLLFILGVQMILNWVWTPLFFGAHLTGAALVCLGAMLSLTLTLYIYVLREKHIRLSLLTLPYLLWLSFAFYLNWFIWVHNPVS